MSGLTLAEVALLAVAGLGAGAVNAVAGGGSLVAFPALLGVGLPAVTANVTNAVAVLPGYLGGSIAYRRELGGQRGRVLKLLPTAVAGGVVGAVLLLATDDALFEGIVPFLILLSCGLLVAQPAISRRIQPLEGAHAQERSAPPPRADLRVRGLRRLLRRRAGNRAARRAGAGDRGRPAAPERPQGPALAGDRPGGRRPGSPFFGPVEWTEAAIVGATSLVGRTGRASSSPGGCRRTCCAGSWSSFGVGVALVLLIQR